SFKKTFYTKLHFHFSKNPSIKGEKSFDKFMKNEEKLQNEKEKKGTIRKTKNDDYVKCLVLHPVFNDNKGPTIETYLAEEAIGLAKSLEWMVVKGPFWKKEYDSTDPDIAAKEEGYDIEKEGDTNPL